MHPEQLLQAARTASAEPGHVMLTLAQDSPFGRAGDLIKMALAPADVTVQTQELDTYLGGFAPYGFAADMVSKVALVNKEAGQRRDFAKENAFELVSVTSGRNGMINEIDHRSNLTSYRVQDYALAAFIPWATENDAMSLYNVRAATGEMIAWKLALARENRIWTALTNTANWNAANQTTLAAGAKWDNGASRNIRGDLQARIKASAQPVTDIFVNPDVAYYFLSDSSVIAYMRQMLGDAAPSSNIAAAAQLAGAGVQDFTVPGLPTFHVVPAKKLNAATGNLDYVLGNHVVLATVPPGVPRNGEQIATHTTFRHQGRSGVGVVTNEYVPQGRGVNSGTMFEMGYSEDAFFGSNIAGGLIASALSF